MLTEEQMQQMYKEDKFLARGIDPNYTPLQEEADSFQYAQEPDLPQPNTEHGGGGTDTDKNWLDNINSAISKPTPAEDLRKTLKIKDGNGAYLFGCTLWNGSRVILQTNKI